MARPPGWCPIYGPVVTSGSRLEAPNRRGVHLIGPRHIDLRLARCESGKGLLALMGGELARAAELDAAILRALATLAGASTDQLPVTKAAAQTRMVSGGEF